MTIDKSVSYEFCSTFVVSINVFECHLSGVGTVIVIQFFERKHYESRMISLANKFTRIKVLNIQHAEIM